MYKKLFAGAFIALMMSAVQALAGHYTPQPPDCTHGGNTCTSVPVQLYSDNFNRSNSSTISTYGNTWYGHEDSSYFHNDISILSNQLKLGAQDPSHGGTNSSWVIHQVDIPTDCCSDTSIVSLTLSFDFVGLNSYSDDHLVVSWDYATGDYSPSSNPLAHVLATYTLGDNTNTVSDPYTTLTFDFDTSVGSVIAFEFAVNVDGCPTCYGNPPPDQFEGVLIDNVSLVLDCPPSETPLPASLPLFAAGLGAVGLLMRRRNKKQKVS